MPPTLRLTLTLTFAICVTSPLAQDRGRGPFGNRIPPPWMTALDTDADGELSSDEVLAATEALLRLDTDGDGNLSSDELAPPRRDRNDTNRPTRRGPGGPPDFGMLSANSPLLRALDKDGDAELYEDEVTDAPQSLRSLDADADGRISASELAPTRSGPGGPRGPGGPNRIPEDRNSHPTPPTNLDPADGAATIPDRATFQRLAYRGDEVLIDTHLADLEFVKFTITDPDGDSPRVYFIDTKRHRAHMMFANAIGLGRAGNPMRGVLVYRPMLASPSNNVGLYTFEFEPEDAYPFSLVARARDLLAQHSPLLSGNLAYHLLPTAKRRYLAERELYDAADFPVFDAQDLYANIAYLPLHRASSYGILRELTPDQRPSARDIVLCRTLPNEMPRVAGILSAAPQTPLSHVNLRAIQDDVPNAYVAGIADAEHVRALLGKFVHYRVADDGYELREAQASEVDRHFAALRPRDPQTPPRDLSVRIVRSLDQIDFADAASVGVKAANLAVLRRIDFAREGVDTPTGFAVPFSIYDDFMRRNGFYEQARAMIASKGFADDPAIRESALANFRNRIKKGSLSEPCMNSLSEVQQRFAPTASIRCRSSTNNEDLPGFSGAGLYDSYTHHPREGHLAKSIKQVYASMWNFRAFEEREFYRIDHFAAAMGVLLHENQSDERANGVAVTGDVVYGAAAPGKLRYYVNVQLGEDLVTNPLADSLPEELLLAPRNPKHDHVIRRSNAVADGTALLDEPTLRSLRRSLRRVHDEFARRYGKADDPGFAMEIEFKVQANGVLQIKQARPWVH